MMTNVTIIIIMGRFKKIRESLFDEVCVVVDGCYSYCSHALVTCASLCEG